MASEADRAAAAHLCGTARLTFDVIDDEQLATAVAVAIVKLILSHVDPTDRAQAGAALVAKALRQGHEKGGEIAPAP